MATIDKIARQVGTALKRAGMTKVATLIVVSAGTRTPGAVSGGTHPTTTNVGARGLVRNWTRKYLNGTEVQATDRVIMLFAALIAGGVVPKVGDRITIEGATTTILDIDRDPASAVYNCLTR